MGVVDVTVVFEGEFDSYQRYKIGQAIRTLEGSVVNRTELACIMHSIPIARGGWGIKAIANELRNVAGNVFVTELSADYYSSFGTYWKPFMDEMD